MRDLHIDFLSPRTPGFHTKKAHWLGEKNRGEFYGIHPSPKGKSQSFKMFLVGGWTNPTPSEKYAENRQIGGIFRKIGMKIFEKNMWSHHPVFFLLVSGRITAWMRPRGLLLCLVSGWGGGASWELHHGWCHILYILLLDRDHDLILYTIHGTQWWPGVITKKSYGCWTKNRGGKPPKMDGL